MKLFICFYVPNIHNQCSSTDYIKEEDWWALLERLRKDLEEDIKWKIASTFIGK